MEESMSSLATKFCNQINFVFTNSTTPSFIDHGGRNLFQCRPWWKNYGGREGLMMKALCMRLTHLGLSAHCVSDMTTPPISSSDLLIASAGPGGFSTVDAICSVAKYNGARVLVLIAQPGTGWCVKYASVVAYVAAQTMANDGVEVDGNSPMLLPMGSVYGGALFMLFEMVVYKLVSVLDRTPMKYGLVTPIWSRNM